MLESPAGALESGAAALVLLALLTAPAVTAAVSHFRAVQPKPAVYEDEDGVATKETTEAYSARLPKAFLVAVTVIGLLNGIALAVLGVVGLTDDGYGLESWFNVGQWVSTRTLFSRDIIMEYKKK